MTTDRTTPDTPFAADLTEVYHTLFDIKDAYASEAGQINSARDDAWKAILALRPLMERLGVPVPRRFDDEGRS